MEPLTIGLAGFFCMVLLMVLRMPIGFSLAVVGFLGFCSLAGFSASFSMLALAVYKTGASYALMVIPLFILMGQFANHSRMGYDLYQAVYRWIGFLPGGLAMASPSFTSASSSSMRIRPWPAVMK